MHFSLKPWSETVTSVAQRHGNCPQLAMSTVTERHVVQDTLGIREPNPELPCKFAQTMASQAFYFPLQMRITLCFSHTSTRQGFRNDPSPRHCAQQPEAADSLHVTTQNRLANTAGIKNILFKFHGFDVQGKTPRKLIMWWGIEIHLGGCLHNLNLRNTWSKPFLFSCHAFCRIATRQEPQLTINE